MKNLDEGNAEGMEAAWWNARGVPRWRWKPSSVSESEDWRRWPVAKPRPALFQNGMFDSSVCRVGWVWPAWRPASGVARLRAFFESKSSLATHS